MTPGQIPVLSSSGGVAATRRDYFTAEEVAKIRDAFPAWIAEGKKEQTQQIRDLLFFYFNVAMHTGLRPGTEMDNLRWNDVAMRDDHVVITVRLEMQKSRQSLVQLQRASVKANIKPHR